MRKEVLSSIFGLILLMGLVFAAPIDSAKAGAQNVIEARQGEIAELRDENVEQIETMAQQMKQIRTQYKVGENIPEEERGQLVQAMNQFRETVKTQQQNNLKVSYQGQLKEVLENQSKELIEIGNKKYSSGNINVMPDVAAQRAIEALKLRNCNEGNNCTVEFKEVGKGNESRLAYQVQAREERRFLGFKLGANLKTDVDAETGEVITSKKPWWYGLTRSTIEEEIIEENEEEIGA